MHMTRAGDEAIKAIKGKESTATNKSFFYTRTQVVNEIDCSTTRQQQSQGNWRQVSWKSQVLAKQMSINDGPSSFASDC